MEREQHRLVVAVTGASGALYARLLLDRLKELKDQVGACGLIFSEQAKEVWKWELGTGNLELGTGNLEDLGWKLYDNKDFYAPMASGSAGYRTMIICPCSMGTLGRIAAGTADDLISRAADVVLKERGRLVLAVREAPYNLIHIRNMQTLTEAGGIICPASPSFYSKPGNLEALAMTVVDRLLLSAGFQSEHYRWGSEKE